MDSVPPQNYLGVGVQPPQTPVAYADIAPAIDYVHQPNDDILGESAINRHRSIL